MQSLIDFAQVSDLKEVAVIALNDLRLSRVIGP